MTNYDAYNAAGVGTGSILGAMMGFLIIVVIIGLVLAVLNIIGTWKILEKANKPGWGAIIPIYNQYLLCQITGVNPWWILIAVCSPIISVIPILGGLASFVVAIYFTILLNVSLARSFGKEDGYAVGLILLAPIFYFILGIKDDKYIGKKPMNDIIFKNNNQNMASNNPVNNDIQPNNNVNTQENTQQNNETNSKPTPENFKYCPSCGTQVESNATYCPSCGKQL